MDGILLIDKPKEWTSFDVVAKIRGQIKRELGVKKFKVGHTGTLDPLATGLLVIVTGSYCKRAQEFSKLDKIYETTMTLGQVSDTGDNEGNKKEVSDKVPTEVDIQASLSSFHGDIMQVPPAYSAIKINGQRAYKLAREGKEVSLEPRKASIYSIELNTYDYPIVRFTTKVSSGTYIRSLVEDIGRQLGTGAYMSDLKRLSVGAFSLDDSVNIEDVNAEQIFQL